MAAASLLLSLGRALRMRGARRSLPRRLRRHRLVCPCFGGSKARVVPLSWLSCPHQLSAAGATRNARAAGDQPALPRRRRSSVRLSAPRYCGKKETPSVAFSALPVFPLLVDIFCPRGDVRFLLYCVRRRPPRTSSGLLSTGLPVLSVEEKVRSSAPGTYRRSEPALRSRTPPFLLASAEGCASRNEKATCRLVAVRFGRRERSAGEHVATVAAASLELSSPPSQEVARAVRFRRV